MKDNIYTEILLDEYKHPQNKGEMKDADLVLDGSNTSCGDKITIYLKIQNGEIKNISWMGDGCVISQVAVSLLSNKIKNSKLKIKNIGKLNQTDILGLLGIESISPGREKCMMLGLETLRKIDLSTPLETSPSTPLETNV